MNPYYQDDSVTLHHGDALDILTELPDASVDAVVTDPPYGLANTTPEQVADTLVRWINGERDYVPSGAGFMGKRWDAFVPPVAVWDECLRVLKPGGHLLAFSGSRTFDLMAIGVRMAEIKASREATQPIRSRTGGSTFRNPPGQKAWALIDAAGCRGLRLGGAQVSEKHTNFLLNTGGATAADLESLGEQVRARVLEHSGIDLHWEIRRIGVPA